MGCGMSTEEKEGKARNEEIENQLKRDRMQQRNEIKMLLLGMSTIFLPRSASGTHHRRDCRVARSMRRCIHARPGSADR